MQGIAANLSNIFSDFGPIDYSKVGSDALKLDLAQLQKDIQSRVPPEETIYQQLKGQQKNLGTQQYFQTGAAGSREGGLGSTDAVLRDMANTLAGAGLTSIEQFARGPVKDPLTVYPETREEARQIGLTSRGRPAYEYIQVPTGRWYKIDNFYDTDGSLTHSQNTFLSPQEVQSFNLSGSEPKTVLMNQGRTAFVNKETGQELTSLTGFGGQGWGGTAAGDGQTIYDVNFDQATGLPIFYNRQTHGRDRYAGLLKAVAIGTAVFAPQIGGAILGSGASAAAKLAVGSAISGFVGSGGDLKTGIKAGLAAYLGGQAGSWASKASNSALVGNIASNMTRTAILGGDMEQALASSLVQSAPSQIIKHFPNFAELPRAAQEAAVAATVDLMRTGGDNLDQIAIKGATDGLTDYTLKQVPGFNDLRSGQKDVVRERLANVLRGESLSNEVLQGAIQMGAEAVRYEVDTDAAKKAGWKSLEQQQAAQSLYGGKVTPAQFADKQETTEEEAKQFAREILGREPTEFEYMQLVGLPERTAIESSDLKAIRYNESTFDSNDLAEAYRAVYGKEPTKEFLESPEAFDMLGRSDAQGKNALQNFYIKDKNETTEAEAIEFLKQAGLKEGDLTPEQIKSMVGAPEAGVTNFLQNLAVDRQVFFDGRSFKNQADAQNEAIKMGYNAYTWDGKDYQITGPDPQLTPEAGAPEVKKPASFNEAFAAARAQKGPGKAFEYEGKLYSTNTAEDVKKQPFDGSKFFDKSSAAIAANKEGKTTFTHDGKVWKIPDNFATLTGPDQSAAETKRLLNAGVKPVSDAELKTQSRGATVFGVPVGTFQDFIDSSKDLGATAKDMLMGRPTVGLGKFFQDAGNFLVGITADKNGLTNIYDPLAPENAQPGKTFPIPFDNPLYQIGKALEDAGNKQLKESITQGGRDYIKSIQDEKDPFLKAVKAVTGAVTNPLSYAGIVVPELVQEAPAMIAGGVVGKIFGLAPAVGVSTAFNMVEVGGNSFRDTYDAELRAGTPQNIALEKALTVMSGNTLITMAVSGVTDAALMKTLVKDFYKVGMTPILKATGSQYVGEGAEAFSHSLYTDFVRNGKLDENSFDKAMTAAAIEATVGATVSGTYAGGAQLYNSKTIGQDFQGRDVTLADFLQGKSDLNMATFKRDEPIMSLGTQELSPGDAIRSHETFLTNTDITPSEYFSTLAIFQDQDYTPTHEELVEIVSGAKPGQDIQKSVEQFIDLRRVTQEEARSFFESIPGYTPTQEDIDSFVRQGANVSQDAVRSEIEQYVNPRLVTAQEVKDAYAALGLAEPTQADIDKLVGQYAQSDLAGRAQENLGTAQYNALKAGQITTNQVQQIVNDALAQNPGITEQEIQDIVTESVGSKTTKPTETDVSAALRSYLGKAPFDAKYDWDGDGKIDLNDTLNLLKASQGKPTSVPAAENSFWNQPTGVYKEIKDAIAGIKFPAGISKNDVTDSIAEYMEANPGLSATDVTEAIAAYMTANPGLTAADLNTAISAATKDLATTTQLADLQNSLAEEIQAAKDIGLKGDAAIQAGLDSLAEKVGINQADLLAQLGTTAADLKTQFATDIAASQKATEQEIADTKIALEAAIADAKVAGLEGDAALKSAIESVAADQKTSAADLLTKLGTTEEALRTEFATGISDLKTQMQEQYDALTVEQKALADSLTAQGETLANAIAEAQKSTETKISDLEAATKEQYNTLTDAQKATADALVAQGKTLADAIETAKTETASQITDVETRLTDAIAAAEAMGLSRDQAITAAVESVAAELGTTRADLLAQIGTTEEALRSEFTTGLAGVSAEVKAAYDSLSADQKALADQLAQQGIDLATAIQTAQQETAGQIETLSADMQAKYDALTAEQKALADAMAQQGLDLTAAIDLAAQQTQAQITGLGEQVDTRINELMQQGQTYQQATQQAIGELNVQNQQMRDLIGTQGRTATQADIDALNEMLGGKRSMDLAYDVTGDKQITQADIDFLSQVVAGTKTDWTAPVGSAFGPTGLYGQLAANEAKRQADLQAQLLREQQAAAEAQRQAQISDVRGTLTKGQQALQQAAQQLPQAYRQAQEVSTPIYGQMGPYLDIGEELDFGFFKPSPEKQAATKQQQPTKIAAGGYIDDLLAGDMTADDLLNLLR